MTTGKKAERGFAAVPPPLTGLAPSVKGGVVEQPASKPPIIVEQPAIVKSAFSVILGKGDVFDPALLKIGSVVEAPLGHIDISPSNARVRHKTNEVDSTAESLKSEGQLQLATGYVQDGKIWLTDGGKRLKAANSAGLPSLKVMIVERPGDVFSAYIVSRIINKERSEQTIFDDCDRWNEFLQSGEIKDGLEISKRLNVNRNDCNKILMLKHIPSGVLTRMRDSDAFCQLSFANEIRKLFYGKSEHDGMTGSSISNDIFDARTQEAMKIIDVVIGSELTEGDRRKSYRDVAAMVDRVISGVKQRVRGENTKVKFFGKVGALKIDAVRGGISLAVRGLNKDELEQVSKKVQELVAGFSK